MRAAAVERMGGAESPDFYRQTQDRPPSETAVQLVRRLERGRRSLDGLRIADIGAGSGPDTAYFLGRQASVVAVDHSPVARLRLESRFRPVYGTRIEVRCSDAERPFVGSSVHGVNASRMLFLIPPARFEWVWRNLIGALKPRGWFAGDFLSPLDEWALQRGYTAHDEPALRALALRSGLRIDHLRYLDYQGRTPSGQAKRFQRYELVAQKIRP